MPSGFQSDRIRTSSPAPSTYPKSLFAPENPDSDGHKVKLELEYGSPQNNG